MTEQPPLPRRPAPAAGVAPPPPSESGARRSLLKRPQFWLVVVAAAILVVVAVLVGTAIGGATGVGAGSAASPSAGTGESTTSPETTQTPPPATAATHGIPTDCAEIYTRDWSSDFAPLVLNPAWTLEPESGVHLGSKDAAAAALLTSNAVVTCTWATPNGGSDRGLTTNVAAVTPAESAEMLAHFGASGFACYEELDGTRCVIETTPGADGQSGESHFFRDDVWIATHWVNAGPDGYTHDIVTAIFG